VEGRLNLAGHVRFARRSEEGQTMAEYAVVIGMITIAIVAVFTSLGESVRNAITAVTGSI
jgi:Flp pilus assembly pilin Flp